MLKRGEQPAVRVNGKEAPLDVERLSELLERLGYAADRPGIATAVNGAVVPRSEWRSKRLSAGDEIEIVGAVQGG